MLQANLRPIAEAGAASPALAATLGVTQDWSERFPHELSCGQLQRVAILRALCARPRFLVADEITAALDPVAQSRIWRTLASCGRPARAALPMPVRSQFLPMGALEIPFHRNHALMLRPTDLMNFIGDGWRIGCVSKIAHMAPEARAASRHNSLADAPYCRIGFSLGARDGDFRLKDFPL